jgi:hypothetical protein
MIYDVQESARTIMIVFGYFLFDNNSKLCIEISKTKFVIISRIIYMKSSLKKTISKLDFEIIDIHTIHSEETGKEAINQ